MPIIIRQVVPNSLIRTDEQWIYRDLTKHDFVHEIVCHKYEFVNRESGIHIQHVESLNNILKYFIKNNKRVITDFKENFFIEECFFWNKKEK